MSLVENITHEQKGESRTYFREKNNFISFMVLAVQLPSNNNKLVTLNRYTLGSSFIVMKPAKFSMLH